MPNEDNNLGTRSFNSDLTEIRPWNLKLQRRPKGFRRHLIKRPWESPIIALNFAAIEIEKVMRGYLARTKPHLRKSLGQKEEDEYTQFSLYHLAATQIQNVFLDFRSRLMQKAAKIATKLDRTSAVVMIQRTYHMHYDKRIFKHLKELLMFRNKGDPVRILRYINPAEANLLDRATRTLVRFRFGGSDFPPIIYYKIFTKGAMCDIGAFAPRYYTCHHDLDAAATNNYPEAISGIRVGNSTFKATAQQAADEEGWYMRAENNLWRSVTAKTLTEVDPISKSSPKPYHYSKVKRNEKKVVCRKQKKRDWLLKVYKEGKQEEGKRTESDSEDELLNWSSSLNFEEYADDWKTIGTSVHS